MGILLKVSLGSLEADETVRVWGNCHEYGRYKYLRPGNMDATIVFKSWITIQD